MSCIKMLCGFLPCVIFLCLQKKTVAGSDVSLECPDIFLHGQDNEIVCRVNSTAIAAVSCGPVPVKLLSFGFKRPTEQTSSSKCQSSYPCTNPDPNLTCGCTQKDGDIFTYKYVFTAHETTDKDGDFDCQICPFASPPLDRNTSDNCKNITFKGPGKPPSFGEDAIYGCVGCACTNGIWDVGTAVFVKLIIDVYIWLTPFFILLAVLVTNVIFSLLLFFSCKDACVFPCLGIPAAFIAVQILAVIIVFYIFKRKNLRHDSSRNKFFLFLFGILLPVFNIAVLYKLLQRRRAPKTTTATPTINSPRAGSSENSYKLTWAVLDEGHTEIIQFIVKYAKVDADTSSDPWKLRQKISDYSTKEVDGKERSVKLEGLSQNAFYEVTITSVTKNDRAEGRPYIFKTA